MGRTAPSAILSVQPCGHVSYRQTEHPVSLLLCYCLLTLLSVVAVSSGAAGVPHPEKVLQEGPVSPIHQSSSGRPGWSRMPQHTAAQESPCPARVVCFCGSEIGQQAEEGQCGRVLLPSPSLPAKPPAVLDS